MIVTVIIMKSWRCSYIEIHDLRRHNFSIILSTNGTQLEQFSNLIHFNIVSCPSDEPVFMMNILSIRNTNSVSYPHIVQPGRLIPILAAVLILIAMIFGLLFRKACMNCTRICWEPILKKREKKTRVIQLAELTHPEQISSVKFSYFGNPNRGTSTETGQNQNNNVTLTMANAYQSTVV